MLNQPVLLDYNSVSIENSILRTYVETYPLIPCSEFRRGTAEEDKQALNQLLNEYVSLKIISKDHFWVAIDRTYHN